MSKLVTPLTDDQHAIITILKQTLAQAEEGDFTTLGVVVCMRQGFASAMAGRDAGSLNLACDDLKRKILHAVTDGSAERQSRRSNIFTN